jgi:hypothetical protein
MEITTTTINRSPARRAAVNALALVGFIALLAFGIWLAIYTVRKLPEISERGGAAAFLSSIFRGADEEPEGNLEVVTSTTTLPILEEEIIATSTPVQGGSPAPSGRPIYTTVVTTVEPIAPYGKADLTVDITAVGYCASDRPSSFRQSRDIDDDRNGGVQFTIKNIGTNNTGRWDFTYVLPTSATERPVIGRSLAPGDAIDYTLCYERPRAGDNRTISVRVDSDRDVDESNEGNNSDSVTVDIDR